MTQRPIVLEIPASSAYLSLVRAATSSICARLGYPVDRLDDTALAVSEAAALLLRDAAPGSAVSVTWTPWDQEDLVGVDVAVQVRSSSGRAPKPSTFSWTVLASLVNHVAADTDGDLVTLRLRSRQEPVHR